MDNDSPTAEVNHAYLRIPLVDTLDTNLCRFLFLSGPLSSAVCDLITNHTILLSVDMSVQITLKHVKCSTK